VPDHLNCAGAGLRLCSSLAGKNGAGGVFGIERVAFAMLMAKLAM